MNIITMLPPAPHSLDSLTVKPLSINISCKCSITFLQTCKNFQVFYYIFQVFH